MINQFKTEANVKTAPRGKSQELTGLFDEMQALMALMPGAAFSANTRLSTEDETEAMFDNMPV